MPEVEFRLPHDFSLKDSEYDDITRQVQEAVARHLTVGDLIVDPKGVNVTYLTYNRHSRVGNWLRVVVAAINHPDRMGNVIEREEEIRLAIDRAFQGHSYQGRAPASSIRFAWTAGEHWVWS